jgi:hypothetical protein
MTRKTSIAIRIAREGGRASFLARIASLPAFLAAAGAIILAILIPLKSDSDDLRDSLIAAVLVLVFAYLCAMVAGWSFDGARSALTPQRVQVMWLRRFQSERGAFRPSRVIDRLSRFGVSALTLQDRDVQLSYEQRRNRLAPVFWILFLPIGGVLAALSLSAWRGAQEQAANFTPHSADFAPALGEIFVHAIASAIILVLVVVAGVLAIMLCMLSVMLISALAGPIGAIFSRKRDDYRGPPRVLGKIESGKQRGATVIRVSDAHRQEAVQASLKAVDVAIIDLSDMTDNIRWEIDQATQACGSSGLVFIAREGAEHGAAALRVPVIYYPASRAHEKQEAERFSERLRTAIYDAYDRTQA